MKTKEKIPIETLKIGSAPPASVLTRSDMSKPNSFDKLSSLLRKNGFALIAGPTGSGKQQRAYSAANQLGYTYIELVNAKKLSARLREPMSGNILDFESLNPFITERTQKSDRVIILKEIGYLTFLEQVSLFAFIRSMLNLDGSEKQPFKNIVIATSTIPIDEFGSEDAVFHPFINFLSEAMITTTPLKQTPHLIPDLAQSILYREGNRLGKPQLVSIAPDVLAEFEKYDWPGNIRELEGVIKVAVTLSAGPQLSRIDFALFFKYLDR